VHISAKWIFTKFRKILRGHVRTVPENMHIKFCFVLCDILYKRLRNSYLLTYLLTLSLMSVALNVLELFIDATTNGWNDTMQHATTSIIWRRQFAADKALYPLHLDIDEEETQEVFQHYGHGRRRDQRAASRCSGYSHRSQGCIRVWRTNSLTPTFLTTALATGLLTSTRGHQNNAKYSN